MSSIVIILTILILVYVITVVTMIVGYYKQLKESKVIIDNPSIVKISVIIAARNEENNIGKCLSSIVNQKVHHDDFEIIVINDHSTDNTLKIVEDFKKDYKNVHCYSLSETSSKKAAIKFGVSKCLHDVVVITDADCEVPINWLSLISSKFNNNLSLLVAPIQLIPKGGLFGAFQELDMFALQGFTFGSLAYNNPILINAANMAFNKVDYVANYPHKTENTPSGDDMFLLEQLKKHKKHKKHINGFLNSNLIVKTKSEKTLIDFLHQRVRWASKSKHYRDSWIQYFGVLTFLTNLALIFICSHLILVEQNRGVYIILLLTKWLIDFILLFLVSSFFKRRKVLIYFLPVQVIYPVYILVVGVLSTFLKIRWKGRIYNG